MPYQLSRTHASALERVRLVQSTTNTIDYISKFGYNPSISTSEEPIWAQSGTAYTFPSTGQSLTVSSGNANDTSAGTGARTVTIEYLDGDYNTASTTVSLNGQTAVAVGTGLRVNRFYVNTAGSGGVNAGVLYVGYGALTSGVPATILASVAAGMNQTLQAIYTIPNGKTGYLLDINAILDAKGEIRLYQRPFGGVFRIQRRWPAGDGQIAHEFNFPIIYAAKTDLVFRGIASAGTLAASVDFEIWLE